MGQQPSKRSRKGSKDKDKEVADAAQTDPHGDGTEETAQSSLSRTTGSETTSQVNGNPATSLHDPTGAAGAKNGTSSTHPTKGAPGLLASSDPQPSTTPSASPKTSTAPLDIQPTTAILSNPTNPFSPGSMNSNGNGAPADGVGSGGKDKAKQLDVDDMIQRLLDVGYTGKVSKSLVLKNAEITAICLAARDVFLNQPTLIELSPPVKIVGDVHGQYSDLIRLFEMCGFPPAANYLFLGDYVDRGKQSLETILLLLCYKIKYPENFFLLRGNHECANVTRGS